MLELLVVRRSSHWEWEVQDRGGTVLVRGRARSRDLDRIRILIPRKQLDPLAPSQGTTGGSPSAIPRGLFAGGDVHGLERRRSELTHADDGRGAASGHIIAARDDRSVDRTPFAQADMVTSLFGRAIRLIEAELESPGLQPLKLSHQLGISRSRLYRLFEPHGGVARYIRKQRLLRIFGALSDPTRHEAVADLAFRHGFEDQSSFSRAFKREFGFSPRDVRAHNAAEYASENHR
jgi:AraC-like DNA-binding protein